MLEADPFVGELVQLRRLDHGVPVGAQGVPPLIVRQEEDDVQGPLGGLGERA